MEGVGESMKRSVKMSLIQNLFRRENFERFVIQDSIAFRNGKI